MIDSGFPPVRLATAPRAFDHPDFIFELKHDRFRAVAHAEHSGNVRLIVSMRSGKLPNEVGRTRDWRMIGVALAIFVWVGIVASVPKMEIHSEWLLLFGALLIAVLAGGGFILWRVTRFT